MRHGRTLCGTAITLLLLLAPGPAGATEARTLHGEFTWNQGPKGDLEAVFTPTGEGTWDVAFHFTFDGEPHTYAGTARGSLSAGKLAGEVKDEKGRRLFRFDGTVEGDHFEGQHAEIADGERHETGTLRLSV